MSKWQPIETAQRRPGPKVDLWTVQRRIEGCRVGKPGDTCGRRVTNAEWQYSHSDHNETSLLPDLRDGWVADGRFVEHPIEYGAVIVTHWMPLPDPPEGGAR